MKWGYFLLIFFIVALIPIVLSIKNSASITGMAAVESTEEEFPEFKTYTKAVCEKRDGFTYCQDEFFANCNGYEFIIPKDDARPIRCGSLVFKVPENKVNGNGIFEEDWKDPRNN